MIPFRPLYGQAQVCFLLFASFALAALQNVTVDDSVSTGAVVPQYLPYASIWNQGNNCSICLVKPDPSLAYNGTWHDATYSSSNGYTQTVEFSFTGSALYIFFIIANSVPNATTLTDVDFVLDQEIVGTYTHNPSTSTDYQYNVPVYTNDSLAFAEHNMIIQPVTDAGGNVLILFDYLIYTTNTSSSSASAIPTSSLSPTSASSPSQAPSGTQGTSSQNNTGAIVGATVGGVAALIAVAASLLCYRRHRRRNNRPSAEEGAVVDQFTEVAPIPLVGTTSSTYLGFPVTHPAPRSKTFASSVTLQSSIPPASNTATSSSGVPSSNNTALLEQVEQLRDEVARLRHLHDSDLNSIELHSEAPPEYSSFHERVI